MEFISLHAFLGRTSRTIEEFWIHYKQTSLLKVVIVREWLPWKKQLANSSPNFFISGTLATKSCKNASISFAMSVCRCATQEPLNGYSWNLIFGSFIKMCQKKFEFWQKSGENKEHLHTFVGTSREEIAQHLPDRKIFRTKVVNKCEAHILRPEYFFLKSYDIRSN
jgi:hypothetical protein